MKRLLLIGCMLFYSSISLGYTPPPAGYICAADIPGHPYNSLDATDALQSAFDTGASKIWVPDMGTDWVINPITLRSDQEIFFESGVTVRAKAEGPYLTGGYLFRGSGISNTSLKGYGVTFKMLKDDYLSSPYTSSEHRHAILLYDCNNIEFKGMTIKDTGGDGIMIGTLGGTGYSENILIQDVTIDNAYRNGISVVSVDGLLIDNTIVINTNGTWPQNGIDFEPDNSNERIVNAVVRNSIIANNSAEGIRYYLAALPPTAEPVTGSIENCTIVGNGALSADALEMTRNVPGVVVKDNIFLNNTGFGFNVDGTGAAQTVDYSAFYNNSSGPVGGKATLGTGNLTVIQPTFISTDINDPLFMYLDENTSTAITQGASDGSYMGARPNGWISEIEDFESYTADTGTNWTGSAVYSGGWIPSFNAYGWAASGSNYIWPDGGYESASPQILRRNDTGTDVDALFWDQKADINSLPIQTIEVKHRGLEKDSNGYGRIIVGTGLNKVEYDNWTGGTGSLNGTSLPNNNVSWTFGSGYSEDWFVTQIEFDYTNNLVRARFGQVQGNIWNDWSSWVSMASTAQPSWVEIQLNGRAEIDDVIFTADLDNTGSWDVDSSGSWHNQLNWTFKPANNTHTAAFGNVITKNTVVYTETDVTVKKIIFDNANQYNIVGAGSVNLSAYNGNASIDVQAGNHEFQTKVVLHSHTDVNISAGASLVLNNALDLNGFDLNFTGSGTLKIENLILLNNGGNISNNGGGTLNITDKNGDGITDIKELSLIAEYWLN